MLVHEMARERTIGSLLESRISCGECGVSVQSGDGLRMWCFSRLYGGGGGEGGAASGDVCVWLRVLCMVVCVLRVLRE